MRRQTYSLRHMAWPVTALTLCDVGNLSPLSDVTTYQPVSRTQRGVSRLPVASIIDAFWLTPTVCHFRHGGAGNILSWDAWRWALAT